MDIQRNPVLKKTKSKKQKNKKKERKKQNMGDMAQRVRALIVLEGPGSIPSTDMVAHYYLYLQI